MLLMGFFYYASAAVESKHATTGYTDFGCGVTQSPSYRGRI
jgi:hypothetical protein